MSLEELKEILKASGLPVAYRAFKVGSAPPLPFICFLVSNSDNFGADGIVYQSVKQVTVELYTAYKDPETEGKLEAALSGSGIYWESFETYIESDKAYLITYEFEVVIQ